MKKLLSLILTLVLMCSLIPAANAATDEAAQSAQTLYELGLFKGTATHPDGTPIFDLDKTPTRNQAVIMLVRLLGKEEEALAGEWDLPFTDVAKGSTVYPYIGYAYSNGLTNGTTATTYGGGNPIRANQYITFVLRALGYESGKDFQVSAAWEFSDEIGLTDGRYSASTIGFFRGDVAHISCTALSIPTKDSDEPLIQQLVKEGVTDADCAAMHGLDAYDWLDIRYHYDIRTFTVYAFINYTGYDNNNGREITGVRKQLRDELNSMDLQLSVPDYYTRKGLPDQYYEAALRAMGSAPEFRYISQGSINHELGDLPAKLREFYQAADIPTLYEKYQPAYLETLALYRTAGKEIIRMISYFDLADKDIPGEFAVETNQLDAQGRTIGFGNTEAYYGYGVLRIGPSEQEPNEYGMAFAYNYVMLRPMLESMKPQLRKLAESFGAQADNNWSVTVNECFSDAFVAYFSHDNDPDFARRGEVHGVLASYIYDRIPEFETYGGEFRSFVKLLLEEYPQYA